MHILVVNGKKGPHFKHVPHSDIVKKQLSQERTSGPSTHCAWRELKDLKSQNHLFNLLANQKNSGSAILGQKDQVFKSGPFLKVKDTNLFVDLSRQSTLNLPPSTLKTQYNLLCFV